MNAKVQRRSLSSSICTHHANPWRPLCLATFLLLEVSSASSSHSSHLSKNYLNTWTANLQQLKLRKLFLWTFQHLQSPWLEKGRAHLLHDLPLGTFLLRHSGWYSATVPLQMLACTCNLIKHDIIFPMKNHEVGEWQPELRLLLSFHLPGQPSNSARGSAELLDCFLSTRLW